MSPFGRFLRRAVGLLLVAGTVTTGLCYPAWGVHAVYLFGWSVGWAVVLGAIGFQSMLRGLGLRISGAARVQAVLLIGLLIRLLVLVGSQGVVFVAFGREWGSRALLATAGFYVLVLGVEVYTLAQELGILGGRPRPADSRFDEGADEASKDSGQEGTTS